MTKKPHMEIISHPPYSSNQLLYLWTMKCGTQWNSVS